VAQTPEMYMEAAPMLGGCGASAVLGGRDSGVRRLGEGWFV